ncbi:extracellular solute-binding protein [Paenibacillaceae bacterium]|nr:extracellular solute-binding protein [Paenibacillaceae bacterium]
MMVKITKGLRFLLLLLLLILSVTACNSSSSYQGVNTNDKITDEGVQPITLKIYFGGEKKAAADEVWQAIGEYVRRKGLNVNFAVQFIPFSQYRDKMLTMAAAGDRWDMNFDADWISFKQMVAKGAYMDLQELLPKYAPNLYRKYEETGNLVSATVNGQVVGLPWNIKMTDRKFAGWRQDLVEKAGIEIKPDSIQTVEDVDWLLRQLKMAYPDERVSRIPPLSIYFVRDGWVDINFYNLGFYLDDPEVRIQAMEQQPSFLDAARMAKSWHNDRLLNRDSLISQEDGATEWRNGRIMFTITSHEWANADPGFADPSHKQAMSLLYPDRKYINRSQLANVIAINRHAMHPELVLQFLDMLETDQTLYDLVQYGILGKTYELDGEMAVYPDGISTQTSNYMEWGGQWALWNTDFLRPSVTYGEGFWERETAFASQPINVDSPLDGLLLSEEEIRLELTEREKAIQKYARPIEFGTAENVETDIAEYVELQKANGLDRILENVQRQVDAYLASRER